VYRALDARLRRDVAFKVLPGGVRARDGAWAADHPPRSQAGQHQGAAGRGGQVLDFGLAKALDTVPEVELSQAPTITSPRWRVWVSSWARPPTWARSRTALPAAAPAAIPRLLRRCLEKDRRRRLADVADAPFEMDEAAILERNVPATDATMTSHAMGNDSW